MLERNSLEENIIDPGMYALDAGPATVGQPPRDSEDEAKADSAPHKNGIIRNSVGRPTDVSIVVVSPVSHMTTTTKLVVGLVSVLVAAAVLALLFCVFLGGKSNSDSDSGATLPLEDELELFELTENDYSHEAILSFLKRDGSELYWKCHVLLEMYYYPPAGRCSILSGIEQYQHSLTKPELLEISSRLEFIEDELKRVRESKTSQVRRRLPGTSLVATLETEQRALKLAYFFAAEDLMNLDLKTARKYIHDRRVRWGASCDRIDSAIQKSEKLRHLASVAKAKRHTYENAAVVWEKVLDAHELTSVTREQVQIFRRFLEIEICCHSRESAQALFKVGTYMTCDEV